MIGLTAFVLEGKVDDAGVVVAGDEPAEVDVAADEEARVGVLVPADRLEVVLAVELTVLEPELDAGTVALVLIESVADVEAPELELEVVVLLDPELELPVLDVPVSLLLGTEVDVVEPEV